MPEDIADLVQKGNNDPSTVVEHYPAFSSLSLCGAWTGMCPASMAAGTGIFFHKAQLRRGSTMALSFPAEPEPPILTRDVAEKVPFANLDDVLAAFNIAPGSAEAANVAATLRLCTSPPNPGEVKACTTSLEATVRRSMDMLGAAADGDHDVWAATSRVPDDRRTSGLLPRQTYRVEAVATLDGDRYVGCHKLPFPYRVYQCHMTAGLTDKAYVVSLRGIGGGGGLTTADMLAFCHHDTARWNPAHPAFELLHTHPGTPVCHFMPYANPVFGKGDDEGGEAGALRLGNFLCCTSCQPSSSCAMAPEGGPIDGSPSALHGLVCARCGGERRASAMKLCDLAAGGEGDC
ncbi:hypothetical protein EJB05_51647, partial [Eragrostis curvula]